MFIQGQYGFQYENLKKLKYWEKREIKEEQYLMLTDFKNFLKVCFHYLGLPTPTRLQMDIADYLQYPKSNKRIILSYRGIGKSYITCIYVLWLLFKDPNERIMIVSVAQDKAIENAVFIKNLILTIPDLKFLTPGQGKIDKRSSALSYVVAAADFEQSPSVKAVGITGRLTGSRATRVLFDDVESPENSMSAVQRAALLQKVTEGTNILKPAKDFPDREVIYLGTPQSFQSIYFEKPNYEIKIWPARYPTKQQYEKFFYKYLADILKKDLEADSSLFEPKFGLFHNRGKLTDPQRYSEEALCHDVEADIGSSNFDLQYMLYTFTGDMDKFKLKIANLIVDDVDIEKAHGSYVYSSKPQDVIEGLPNYGMFDDYFHRPSAKSPELFDYEGTIMYVDPAGNGTDELAYVVLSHLNGYIFVKTIGGFIGTDGNKAYGEENMLKLANIAKKHKVNKIVYESNGVGQTFGNLIKPFLKEVYPCTTEGENQSQGKITRIIDNLQAPTEVHRVIFGINAIFDDQNSLPTHLGEKGKMYSVFYQMSRVTADKGSIVKKDRLDVLSSGVGYLRRILAIDKNEANEDKLMAAKKRRLHDLYGIGDRVYNKFSKLKWNSNK